MCKNTYLYNACDIVTHISQGSKGSIPNQSFQAMQEQELSLCRTFTCTKTMNNIIKERQKPQKDNITSLTYYSQVNTDCTRFHSAGWSATSSIFPRKKRTSYGTKGRTSAIVQPTRKRNKLNNRGNLLKEKRKKVKRESVRKTSVNKEAFARWRALVLTRQPKPTLFLLHQ